jgi:hypothetical protein
MADTSSALLQLTLQETGNNDNNWGDILNDTLQRIEDAIANSNSTATTGGSTTLTDNQSLNEIQIITGVLASNATIIVPTREKAWTFRNATTGNFTVTVKTTAGTGVIVQQGASARLFCDGTDVLAGTPGASAATLWSFLHPAIQTIASGTTVDLATATSPTVYVSGNTAITGFGTVAAGLIYTVIFTGTPQVTSGGTITIPGGTRTMAAGDALVLLSTGSGNWTVLVGYAANGTTFANATTAQFWANTAAKVLTTDQIWAAAAPVTLTYGASFTPDLNTFINGEITLTGNITLNAPTNYKVGQTFSIKLIQDASGSRLATWNSAYKFPNGMVKALTTTGSAYDFLEARVWSSTEVECSLARNFA